jgi:hypothetical protein
VRRRTVAVIILSSAAVLALGAFSVRELGRGEEKVRQCVCMSNVKEIGDAIRNYRDDHDGQYPPSLHALYPHYLASRRMLVCPGDRRAETGGKDYTSYIYTRPETEPKSHEIILEEKQGNHSRWGKDLAGHMVLYANGDYEWLTQAG